MSENLSAKYYQQTKESLQEKSSSKISKPFFRKKRKKETI